MQKTEGRTAARQELRAALITAATRIIAAEGTRGLKARDLASEVGCALGSIYNVFPDMDALVLAVRIETLDRLEAAISARLGDMQPRDAGQASARLLELADVYIDFAHDNWGLWSAAFEHTAATGAAWQAYVERVGRIFHWIEVPLGLAMGSGGNGNVPEQGEGQGEGRDRLPLLTRALFSAVHGIVLNGLDQSLGDISLDDLRWQARTILVATLAGLGRT